MNELTKFENQILATFAIGVILAFVFIGVSIGYLIWGR